MDEEGDPPEVLWEYAEALRTGGDVPAGKPGIDMRDGYRDALGR